MKNLEYKKEIKFKSICENFIKDFDFKLQYFFNENKDIKIIDIIKHSSCSITIIYEVKVFIK